MVIQITGQGARLERVVAVMNYGKVKAVHEIRPRSCHHQYFLTPQSLQCIDTNAVTTPCVSTFWALGWSKECCFRAAVSTKTFPITNFSAAKRRAPTRPLPAPPTMDKALRSGSSVAHSDRRIEAVPPLSGKS
ncbi:hypothetical protein COCVIDRAFT_18934 [Bipolaris victoriae FI3]|uniref:Uncharacterized protein n=2 Tax=Bipolaris TaxID=33194 RepID=W6Y5J1_COCC2|nr:uncharacterized protein COCCADRAFT_26657 [Bipolaris zeicola 26-R-13]XP_014553084.1 hypothetical protein COCVIDRAFT_18934 [Bipolaris victoriae FI3]EUC32920.1 hypothetical protein COCCADRAFT_26657 [Bipolaris zeicola 26-R-13]